jgi:hypothetical protein
MMLNKLSRYAVCTLLLALGATVGGCNVLGALAYKVAGEPDVPAKYTLEKRPTVIVVENYANYDLGSSDAELLAQRLQTRLQEKDLAPFVGFEKVLDLRATQPSKFRTMTIPQIGRAVGAEQVIYVHFQGGGVASMGGGSLMQGKASVLVKVVDAKTGASLWPKDMTDGQSVGFETSPTRGGDRAEDVHTRLYDGLSQNIARLFYKNKPSDEEQY